MPGPFYSAYLDHTASLTPALPPIRFTFLCMWLLPLQRRLFCIWDFYPRLQRCWENVYKVCMPAFPCYVALCLYHCGMHPLNEVCQILSKLSVEWTSSPVLIEPLISCTTYDKSFWQSFNRNKKNCVHTVCKEVRLIGWSRQSCWKGTNAQSEVWGVGWGEARLSAFQAYRRTCTKALGKAWVFLFRGNKWPVCLGQWMKVSTRRKTNGAELVR